MLEFGDIITLENEKKYLVAGTCSYDDKNYVYLVEFCQKHKKIAKICNFYTPKAICFFFNMYFLKKSTGKTVKAKINTNMSSFNSSP